MQLRLGVNYTGVVVGKGEREKEEGALEGQDR